MFCTLTKHQRSNWCYLTLVTWRGVLSASFVPQFLCGPPLLVRWFATCLYCSLELPWYEGTSQQTFIVVMFVAWWSTLDTLYNMGRNGSLSNLLHFFFSLDVSKETHHKHLCPNTGPVNLSRFPMHLKFPMVSKTSIDFFFWQAWEQLCWKLITDHWVFCYLFALCPCLWITPIFPSLAFKLFHWKLNIVAQMWEKQEYLRNSSNYLDSFVTNIFSYESN